MSVDNLPDTLNELIQQVEPMGPIATLISRTLKAVLLPDEQVLICFHQLQSSETQAEGQRSPFGSLDLRMLTNGRFLTIGFYPAYHQIDVKDVHKVSHFSMINRFSTGYEGEGDVTTAEERGFRPIELEMQIKFEDSHGQEIFTWSQDATRAEDISTLFKQMPTLSKLVGKPLASYKG